MKFVNVYNNQNAQPVEEETTHTEDFDVAYAELLAEVSEIKKLDAQCIEAEESYLIALEAYEYHHNAKTNGKEITANDLSMVNAKLDIAAKQAGLNLSDLATHTEAYKTYMESDVNLAFDIASESIGETLSKIFQAIKNMIIKITDMIRNVYVKLMTLYPVLQSNLNKIIVYLTDRLNLPRKDINKNELKWIVNKAPCVFAMAKDSAEVMAFLNNKRREGSIGSIYDDAIKYGNAILNSKSSKDEAMLINNIKKVTNQIMSSPDNSIYSKLQNVLPELKDIKGKVCIYRADGRTVKYRVLTADEEDNGVPVIKSSINSITINPLDEEQIRIGKIYTPQEVIAIGRADITYISEIKTYYSGLSKVIDGAKQMVNGIEKLMSTGIAANEGVKSTIVRNFFNLSRSGLGLLNSDILLCYYNTARDVYYAVYKFADLWYGKGSIAFQDNSEK